MKSRLTRIFKKAGVLLRNKTMVSYVFGYLLILLIPLLGTFLLNNRYFVSLYQNEVIGQNQASIERLEADLDAQANLFFAISGQLSTQEAMQNRTIYGNVTAFTAIHRSLQGFSATHRFFDNIAFYSVVTPDTVYTNNGTFNTGYYKHYRTENEDCRVHEILASVRSGTWLLPESIYWPYDNFPVELEYAMPVPGSAGSYVMFSIPESSFSSIVHSKNMQTVIFDKGYRQLYPFTALGRDKLDLIRENEKESLLHPVKIPGGSYLLGSRSEKTGLLCIRIISRDVMLADVIRVQRIFTAVLLLLTVLGGITVYLMAFLNYRPIRKLSKLASDKVNDIPTDLYGTDRACFALEKLDRQLESYTRKALREKLLYKLIHGRKLNKDKFDAECVRAGLCFSACFMRVVLVFFETESTSKENIDIMSNVDQILSSQYELCGMEYLENNCYLFIIGYDTDRSEILKNRLNAVASNFSQYTTGSVKITVGGPCREPAELSRSYFQAVLASKLSSSSGSIIFHDDTNISDVRFVYPKIELDSLFSAIVHAHTDKIKLITDILVDMIYANRYNNFISVSLCYDIINTYLRAMEELNAPGAGREYSYGKYEDLCDVSDVKSFIDIIYDLRNQAVKMMNAPSVALQPDNLTAKIISYINLHYKDMELCVSHVAEHFRISISNLSHHFKSQTGLNISDYISEKKLIYAKELLRDTDMNINDVAFGLGYNHTSSFIRKFKQCENMTPNEYRMTFGSAERCEKTQGV